MNKLTFTFLLLIIISPLIIFGQSKAIKGKVVDSKNGHPLAFVNIQINEGRYGGTSDIDGVFELQSNELIKSLKFSYVGYEPKEINIEGSQKNLKVELKRLAVELMEVLVYPEENPAHRIINNVIEHRKDNDPENLKSFSYTSYDKMIFTVDVDSLTQMDTSYLSSSEKDLVEFFGEKDIFIMETVSERKFLHPDRNYENVIATKVSGFKDPIFIFLISQIQSTSFYDEMIRIANMNYVNPISRGSTKKYFFQIEDTTYSGVNDTVFIISFRPMINTNFDGLKGVLMINTNGWAIQNVRAEPASIGGGFNIRVQQLYEHINGEKWFPVQLNTDVIFQNIAANADSNSYYLVGIGKSYIRDIELNPEIVRRQLGVLGVDVEPKATSRDNEFWTGYRIDSLSKRDLRTYEFMDSVGREAQFDRIAKSFETIMKGSIPWKIFDIHLHRILRYNPYEGLYLGLGASTNDKLSRFISLGGYWGYGFGDQRAKYGGNIDLTLYRQRNLKLRLAYFYDVTESGGVRFFDDRRGLLQPDNFRQFLIKRENITESYNAGLSFRALRHFNWFAGLNVNTKYAYKDYDYGITGNGVGIFMNEFKFTELIVGTRFAFREKIIQTPRASISLGTDYPVFWVQYTHGFNNILDGEFEYDRVDVKVEKSFYTKYLGETSVQLKAGYIDGNLPYCNLYNGNGSFRTFTIFAENSFATMRMNEFLSNRYAAIYFSHNFGNLLIRTEKFEPEFVVLTNAAIGDLNNPEYHFNTNFKTMEHGYYESGLLINNLLNLRIYNVGIGGFYRWGPYSYKKSFENMAFKISFVFPFQRFSSR